MNWVVARSKCSPAAIFIMLAEVVDNDVKSALKLPGGKVFRLTRHEKKLVVLREGEFLDSVVFELDGDKVHIRRGADTPLFSCKASFREDGECGLDVDGRALELWQVSRAALEDLFFS